MAWQLKSRGVHFLGCIATVVVLSACGEDKGTGTGNGGEGDGSTESPDGLLDAGGPRRNIDAGPTVPPVIVEDGGGAVIETPDGAAIDIVPDGAAPSDPGDGDGLLPALPPGITLPTDGNKLSACYNEEGCTGDNLSCVHALGLLGAGYCYDKCETSEDCQPLEGIESICSIESQCVFDCTGDGLGGGDCPANMVCRNIVPGLAVPIFRCEYPYGSGGKITPAYGQCNTAHGSNDCEGDNACYVPISGIVTPPAGPGYCAPSCQSADECQVPAGATATATCSLLGRCQMNCSEEGATCPTGMECVDVDQAPLITAKRCRYPL
jgi:hypothetical protein